MDKKAKSKRPQWCSMLLRWATTKYGIVTIIFVVWTCFLDEHTIFTHYQLSSTITDLEQQVKDNMALVEVAKREKLDIEQNIEKYAREKYYMHRKNEDVLIIDTKKVTDRQ